MLIFLAKLVFYYYITYCYELHILILEVSWHHFLGRNDGFSLGEGNAKAESLITCPFSIFRLISWSNTDWGLYKPPHGQLNNPMFAFLSPAEEHRPIPECLLLNAW